MKWGALFLILVVLMIFLSQQRGHVDAPQSNGTQTKQTKSDKVSSSLTKSLQSPDPGNIVKPQLKLEELENHVRESGMLTQMRANRLTPEEQKQAALLLEQITDLRSQEIERRLAAVRRKLSVTGDL